MGSLARRLQRAVLTRDRGLLRLVFQFGYAAVLHAIVLMLRRASPGAAAYVAGSYALREPVHGLSDIDVVVVVPGDPARASARWDALRKRLPGFVDGMVDLSVVGAEDALEASATAGPLRPEATCLHAGARPDPIGIRERPGLYAPLWTWRRVEGPELLGRRDGYGEQERRIAAWLELQHWYRWLATPCLAPDSPHSAYLAMKLLAEPVRIALWLEWGEQHGDRRSVLAAARRAFPEEAEAIEAAQTLLDGLSSLPPAPLGALLPASVRFAERIAARITSDLAEHGTTEVALLGDPAAELVTDNRSLPRLRTLDPAARPLALPDWRALVVPALPDAAIVPLGAQIDDHRAIAAAAANSLGGPYPALRRGPLVLLPGADATGRATLRSVHCAAVEPAVFAVLDGAAIARYPDVAGWSIEALATRALAEHRAWLAAPAERPERRWMRADDTPQELAELGLLLSAVRAEHLAATLADGAPELPLTLSATVAAASGGGDGDLLSQALGEYRARRPGRTTRVELRARLLRRATRSAQRDGA